MEIAKHLDKNNLHHAYLIGGPREEIIPQLLDFFDKMDIKTSGSPDFYNVAIDSFKIEDAFNLRTMCNDKGFTTAKKIFIIGINNITLDAQSVLLKMFEEPIENTHFFLIVPDTHHLLKTLTSRFYLISSGHDLAEGVKKDVEKFINMNIKDRINFIKELLIEPDEEGEESSTIVAQDSARSKALKFINELEVMLAKTVFGKDISGTGPDNKEAACFEHFFKVREFLRMPGSSTKNLLESVALIIPTMPNI